ncbi:hypothetical protein BST61_g11097 [Cercospora zeina]
MSAGEVQPTAAATAAGGSHKTTDLARIRDNQRRSRQRRKEYLNELEAKYRNCELVGIRASAEIQAVARQVAEENRRLRGLLVKYGVSVGEIYGDGDGVGMEDSKVRELEGLIGRSRQCGGGGGETGTSEMEACEDSAEVERGRRCQMAGKRRRLSREKLANVQRSPSATDTSEAGVATSSAIVGGPQSENNDYTHEFDITNAQVPSLEDLDPYYSSHKDLNESAQDWQLPQTPDSGQPHHTSRDLQHRSCRDVAEAIRYVRPTLSQQELEQEMGCQPGKDCKVRNYEAFDLMDRLSERMR